VADPRHLVGRKAERAVADWLTGHGWVILAERERTPDGEIDLVALDPERRLVAVEVRLRRTAHAGSPLESVSPRHLRRVRTALLAYAQSSAPPHCGLRVDLVAVTPGSEPSTWRLSRTPGVDAW
jgi:putative endonuclease